jgi:CheY-like chemotaxis protein
MSPHVPVLLVEDDRATRSAYSLLLRRAGFEVFEAQDGQQALDMLEKGILPEVLVVDLHMPGVSGQELISQIHTDPALREIPTVVITGMPREEAQVIADTVLTKPIEGRDFVAAVRAAHKKFRN